MDPGLSNRCRPGLWLKYTVWSTRSSVEQASNDRNIAERSQEQMYTRFNCSSVFLVLSSVSSVPPPTNCKICPHPWKRNCSIFKMSCDFKLRIESQSLKSEIKKDCELFSHVMLLLLQSLLGLLLSPNANRVGNLSQLKCWGHSDYHL